MWKTTLLPMEKFLSLVLSRNAIMLQHLTIQFPLCYLTSGHLWEVRNYRKLQAFSSESGRGHLQKVTNIEIWHGKFWYFGKLVAEERWLQPEVPLYFRGIYLLTNSDQFLKSRFTSQLKKSFLKSIYSKIGTDLFQIIMFLKKIINALFMLQTPVLGNL